VIIEVLKIDKKNLLDNTESYVLSCQTYEGGFGPAPNREAHGGYTYCAIASLHLLKSLQKANIPKLYSWLSNK
jgi:protein farnesyltransferase subunit beta